MVIKKLFDALLKNMKKILLSLILFLLPFDVLAKVNTSAKFYPYQEKMLSQISLYSPNDAKYEGDGVIVAVIDSGVWLQHPDLINTNWVNKGEIAQNGIDDDRNGYIDDYYGWNFTDNNNNLTTKSSHGTSVAGLIVGQGYGINGIAPKAKILYWGHCIGVILGSSLVF